MKILFICSGGIQRSPTFSKWFNNNTEHEAQHMGIWNYPTPKLFEWADKIFVMDLGHELWIKKFRPEHLHKTEVVGISDQYQPDEEDLIELVEYWHQKRFKKE